MDSDSERIVFAIFAILAAYLLLTFMIVLQAHAVISITNPRTMGACAVYNICLNIKINGHPEPATLDTGTDFTLIPQSYASTLRLENLPTSNIIGRDMPFSGIGGGSQNLHSVDVQMNIENSKTFYAGVLLNQGDTPPVILLSLHDFYKVYRLSFTPVR